MKALLKFAWMAGVVPLVVGTAIFISWLFLRTDYLMAVGVITIYAGLCSVGVGAVCLAIYVWRTWRSAAVSRRRVVWQSIALAGLFLANFIAAGGFVYGAIMIETRYNLSITNHSGEPLRAVRVDGGGVSIRFEDIPAGQTAKLFTLKV